MAQEIVTDTESEKAPPAGAMTGAATCDVLVKVKVAETTALA